MGERVLGRGVTVFGEGHCRYSLGPRRIRGEDASSEMAARMNIDNPSHWDQVYQAPTLASNRGTMSRHQGCIYNYSELPDDEDENNNLDWLDPEREGIEEDKGGGEKYGWRFSNARIRIRAITSATVTGNSSNLGTWVVFLWRRVRFDSSNQYRND